MNKTSSAEKNGGSPSGGQERIGRRGKALRRVLVFVPTVLVLLLLLSLVFPKALDTDRVVRFFRYMGLKDKENYGHVSFDANSSNAYAAFDGGLLVGSESGLVLLSLDGEQKAFLQGSMPTPVVRSGDEICVCFSPGSSYYAVLGRGGKTLADQTITGSFLDASVSRDGYLCLLTSESGYKAIATVMNPKLETTFKFSSRTHYLNACAISEGGGRIAVSSLGEEHSIYRSGVTILKTDEALADLDAEDSSAVRADLGNQIIYHLEFVDREHLCAIGQSAVTFLDVKGNVLQTVPLTDQALSDYAVGDGFVLLCLSLDGTGTRYRILSLDAEGDLLGERTILERVRSVSAAGRYAGILTDLQMKLFDKKLTEYKNTDISRVSSRVLLRSDGTALLVSTNSADLLIP